MSRYGYDLERRRTRAAGRRLGRRACLLLGAVWLAGCGGRPAGRAVPEAGAAISLPELGGALGCGPDSAEELVRCVDEGRLADDVVHIARLRPPGSAGHEHVRRMCETRLTAYGFEVRAHRYGSGVNVVGVKPSFTGRGRKVIVGAHYDHLPECHGADDNASGVASLLEAARVLSSARFDRELVVACWDEHERGYLGSRAYAEEARPWAEEVAVTMHFDAVGYASAEPNTQTVPDRFEELFPEQALALFDNDHRADFLAVVSESSTRTDASAVALQGALLGLPVHVLELTQRQKLRQKNTHRSDHGSFWEAGMPALLLTDTGSFRNARHHCAQGDDTPDTLDRRFHLLVTQAAIGALVGALELRPPPGAR